MNQKKFLTILPVVTLVLIFLALIGMYLLNQIQKNGCIGTRTFIDEGLGLDFEVDCQIEVTQNTDFDKKIHILTNKKGNARLNFELINTKQPNDFLDITESGFKVINITDNLIRITQENTNSIYYANTKPCEDNKSKTCSDYLIKNISTKYPVRLSVELNGEDVEEIDRLVKSLLE